MRALLGFQFEDILAQKCGSTLACGVARATGQYVAQGALAGPVRSHDGVHFPSSDIEV